MDRLIEEIAQELRVGMMPNGIWKTVAQEIGAVNTVKLLFILNGDSVYVPKPDRILVPARNKLIQKEFTGYNYDALAQKYGLTRGYIRRLCEKLVDST